MSSFDDSLFSVIDSHGYYGVHLASLLWLHPLRDTHRQIAERGVDKALQRLRKAGRIAYTRQLGWRTVEVA